ncbi:MAG: hydrogenase 4 subunit F, partial [Candidatus Omnitrophica bacterium CG_4_9_14_0_2_um_filter_42_8]
MVLCGSILLLKKTVLSGGVKLCGDFIYLDALSAFFIFVISVVAFAAALYSVGYIRKDIEKGIISEKKARVYYILFNLFCCSMLFVPAVNNLGILWVAIEMTTLISAFLVGFYNSKESVEAAWKYIIICSVGIIFALLGTILFYYAFSLSGGTRSLNWSIIAAGAANMDKNILKVAFIFILVGYGTKAGLAPMHTWLPDAHSQAVSPISALLSGVLLKTAIYAILRFGIIIIKGVGFAYFSNLMILFGMISLAISCGFILVQKDLKRLLAYHSVEHVGIISIGLGIGG